MARGHSAGRRDFRATILPMKRDGAKSGKLDGEAALHGGTQLHRLEALKRTLDGMGLDWAIAGDLAASLHPDEVHLANSAQAERRMNA